MQHGDPAPGLPSLPVPPPREEDLRKALGLPPGLLPAWVAPLSTALSLQGLFPLRANLLWGSRPVPRPPYLGGSPG